jgi:hypothetical protein
MLEEKKSAPWPPLKSRRKSGRVGFTGKCGKQDSGKIARETRNGGNFSQTNPAIQNAAFILHKSLLRRIFSCSSFYIHSDTIEDMAWD